LAIIQTYPTDECDNAITSLVPPKKRNRLSFGRLPLGFVLLLPNLVLLLPGCRPNVWWCTWAK